ncbi:MAG: RAMP superfamily CRISPR-associated protein [Saprospiraceae bacterium]
MKLSFQIKFLSDWHCGSGLTLGAEADAEVIKDKNGLPYIPGKTIKGLLRSALESVVEFGNKYTLENIDNIFGKNAENVNIAGKAHFSSAKLNANEAEGLRPDISSLLYRNIASTSINEDGVAVAGSLRTIQVCMPITLSAHIEGISEDDVPIIEYAFKLVRHVGVNRNHGLGRCQFANIITTN